MTKAERELIELKFKGLYEHNETNYSLLHQKLGQIHDETKSTNGRVTSLEKDLNIVRFFSKYPKILILAVLGIIALVQMDTIIETIKTFIK